MQRCLADLLARESKDELADFEGWVQMVTQRFREERAAGAALRHGDAAGPRGQKEASEEEPAKEPAVRPGAGSRAGGAR